MPAFGEWQGRLPLHVREYQLNLPVGLLLADKEYRGDSARRQVAVYKNSAGGLYSAAMEQNQQKHPDSAIIDRLGGTDAVTELCAPRKKASISQWRKRGIPPAWRKYLQKIRPSAFK